MSGMKPINIEILMNHSVGISDSYYRATESELLQDYLKAVSMLSIKSNNNRELQAKVRELSMMNENNEYLIKSTTGKRRCT